MEELCDVCDAKTRQICSGCNLAIYCSERCQAHDWEDHQDVCYIACGAEKMEEEEEADNDDAPEGDVMDVDSDIGLIGLPNFLQRRQMRRRARFGRRSAKAAGKAKSSTGLKKAFYKAKGLHNRRKGGIANKKVYQ
jgi:hypothetical protein